jgi:hypothetical protein
VVYNSFLKLMILLQTILNFLHNVRDVWVVRASEVGGYGQRLSMMKQLVY